MMDTNLSLSMKQAFPVRLDTLPNAENISNFPIYKTISIQYFLSSYPIPCSRVVPYVVNVITNAAGNHQEHLHRTTAPYCSWDSLEQSTSKVITTIGGSSKREEKGKRTLVVDNSCPLLRRKEGREEGGRRRDRRRRR